MKVLLPFAITLAFTILLYAAGYFSKQLNWTVLDHPYLNQQFKYQVLLVILAACSLVVSFLLNSKNFIEFFSWGRLDAPTTPLKILGIREGESWKSAGISMSLIITAITALFMYFQLKETTIQWSVIRQGAIWIVLFSLTNSFGEEIIYRLGMVVPLYRNLPPNSIFIASGVLFGLAHMYGMPNGIIGVTLAGILGYILAKSVLETNGIFWAWFIHFLQDVVIIGSIFLVNSK